MSPVQGPASQGMSLISLSHFPSFSSLLHNLAAMARPALPRPISVLGPGLAVSPHLSGGCEHPLNKASSVTNPGQCAAIAPGGTQSACTRSRRSGDGPHRSNPCNTPARTAPKGRAALNLRARLRLRSRDLGRGPSPSPGWMRLMLLLLRRRRLRPASARCRALRRPVTPRSTCSTSGSCTSTPPPRPHQ